MVRKSSKVTKYIACDQLTDITSLASLFKYRKMYALFHKRNVQSNTANFW